MLDSNQLCVKIVISLWLRLMMFLIKEHPRVWAEFTSDSRTLEIMGELEQEAAKREAQ